MSGIGKCLGISVFRLSDSDITVNMGSLVDILLQVSEGATLCLGVSTNLVLQTDKIQGGSNMTGTDLCVNKPHCAAAVRP